nr:hypothetical protein Iba_chr08aCG0050 [Ipomoea batatas]
MESLTERSHSISRRQIDFFCGANGSNFQSSPNTEAARFVIALEIARAVHTPFPPPDISSPNNSFANRLFINSTSDISVSDLGGFMVGMKTCLPPTTAGNMVGAGGGELELEQKAASGVVEREEEGARRPQEKVVLLVELSDSLTSALML